jgi:2-keto-4-pentenoate hydratase
MTADIAARFLTARRQASGLADYPGAMPLSLDEAYSIQNHAIAAWNRSIVGWKVGRVQEPFASRLGADRLAGPIFFQAQGDDGSHPKMPVFSEGFAAAEAEFLLRIGKTPPPDQQKFSLEEAADLIDVVSVGIEVASSPLRTINQLGPIAIVSDFGNNNGLIVGHEIRNWRSSSFEKWQVRTLIDGELVGTGTADSFPDGAIGSARFLFELMARRGIALKPGQWISTGAVTGVHDARAGQRVEAIFNKSLQVSCVLVPQTGT